MKFLLYNLLFLLLFDHPHWKILFPVIFLIESWREREGKKGREEKREKYRGERVNQDGEAATQVRALDRESNPKPFSARVNTPTISHAGLALQLILKGHK